MLDRRLRSEQDAEYQRALAADQDRERQRQEAAQAEAAKAQAAQDAAAQARHVQLAGLACVLIMCQTDACGRFRGLNGSQQRIRGLGVASEMHMCRMYSLLMAWLTSQLPFLWAKHAAALAGLRRRQPSRLSSRLQPTKRPGRSACEGRLESSMSVLQWMLPLCSQSSGQSSARLTLTACHWPTRHMTLFTCHLQVAQPRTSKWDAGCGCHPVALQRWLPDAAQVPSGQALAGTAAECSCSAWR